MTRTLVRDEGTSFDLTLFRAAEDTAPVLLVQPAMGMKAGYYVPLAEALRAAGHHVVLGELRGHEARGGRTPGRGYDFGYAEMVEDVAASVASVREEFRGSPVHLLGHSLGGQISLVYAATRPGEVDGIVLVAACTVHWPFWGRRFWAWSQSFVPLSTLVGHFPGRRVGFAGREARGVVRDWAHLARTGRFPFGEAALADLDLPVLSVSIEGDDFAPRAPVDGLVAKLPRADVTREHLVADGPNHFRWARSPDGVVALVGSWLGDR